MLGILYLMTILSNKRKGIIEEIIPFEDKETLDHIISGVDVLARIKYSDLSKEEEYLIYEEALGKYLRIITKEDSLSTDDEQVLIKNSVDVGNEEFHNAELTIDPHVKELLKKIGITVSGLNDWFKKPEYVRKFEIDKNINYLCTKRITYRGKIRILFYHLSIRNTLFDNRSAIHTVLLLDPNTYERIYNNPIRVFLSILNNYGLPINVKDVTKRFFLSITGNQNLITTISCQLTKNSYLSMEGNGLVFVFIYAIDTGKYLRNYKYKMD